MMWLPSFGDYKKKLPAINLCVQVCVDINFLGVQ